MTAVSPADVLLYARLASEAAELVSNLMESQEKEKKGQKPTKAELDKIERKKERVNKMWRDLGPDANVLAPDFQRSKKDNGENDGDTSS